MFILGEKEAVKARYPVWLNQRLEKQLKAINDRQCAVKFPKYIGRGDI
jgi:hypothetical protein